MNKKVYPLIIGSVLASAGMYANDGALLMTIPKTLLEYQVAHLSPNGEWACGIIMNGSSYSGWRYDLTTGEILELTPVGVPSMAIQVSNDGIVAGTFPDSEATGNGAEIESAGYWKDGKWHHLSTTSSSITDYDYAATANAISANGKYIGGQAYIDNIYTPVIWEDGVMRTLPLIEDIAMVGGAVFSVADNGYAAGWAYSEGLSRYDNKTTNRNAAIWCPEIYTPSNRVDHQNQAILSPSGKYSVAYAQFEYFLYNTETKDLTEIKFDGSYKEVPTIYSVTDNGDYCGVYDKGGFITIDNTFYDAQEYLQNKGADLTDKWQIGAVYGMSQDCKTFATMAYDLTFQGTEGGVRVVPLFIKLDENVTTREPAGVDAMVLEGANAVNLTWRVPLAGAENVTGYEIFIDGQKHASVGADVLSYTATKLTNGSHSFTVKADYSGTVSIDCKAAVVEITDVERSKPLDAIAVQSRYNDVRLLWNAPGSSYPSLQYHNDDDKISGLGWGNYTLECGTRFTSDMLAAYGAEAKLEGVTFYPMSLRASWEICIYDADDTTKPLYSQVANNNELVYGSMNTLKFTTPFAIPAGKDIIVAVRTAADLNAATSSNVLGRITGKKRIGYTDLLRRVGTDAEFFSMYELSMGNEQIGAEDNTMWPIGALISNSNISEEVVSAYEITENGVKLGTTTDATFTVKKVSEGNHTYSIAAVYSDGKISEATVASVNVANNREALAVQNLKVTSDGLTATLSWDAPANDDASTVSYASGNEYHAGPTGSADYNYSYTVAAQYPNNKLKAFKGYQIKAFKFLPLSTAYFSFFLTKNGEDIAYREVLDDEYIVGQWNTIVLDEAIELDPQATYLLALECIEPGEGNSPIALDNKASHAYNGDLFSQGDQPFGSLSAEGDGVYGNWMIGMVIADEAIENTDFIGYNVQWANVMGDFQTINAAPVNTTEYSYTFNAAGTYRMRVTSLYDGIEELESEVLNIKVSEAGVNEIENNFEFISEEIFNLQGIRVANKDLIPGIYLVRKTTNKGTVITEKLIISE